MKWAADNLPLLGMLGAVAAFIWSVFQFFDVRRREHKHREFETYHKLIRDLVSPETGSETMWIDRQVAIVFELRSFPRYFDVTERVLSRLKDKWSDDPEFRWKYLIEEIELSLQHISKFRGRWYRKLLSPLLTE